MYFFFWGFGFKLLKGFFLIRYFNFNFIKLPSLNSISFNLGMLNYTFNSIWLGIWLKSLSIFLTKETTFLKSSYEKFNDGNLFFGSITSNLYGKFSFDFFFYFITLYLLGDRTWYKDYSIDYWWYFTNESSFSFKLADISSVSGFKEIFFRYREWDVPYLVHPIMEFNFFFGGVSSFFFNKSLFFRSFIFILKVLGFPFFESIIPLFINYYGFFSNIIFNVKSQLGEYSFWGYRGLGWVNIKYGICGYLLLNNCL